MIGIVALVIGLGLGMAASSLMRDDVMEPEETAMESKAANEVVAKKEAPTTATKAADLRVVINSLQRQHVDLASAAVRNGFDGSADFKASADSLDANSIALSKAIGSVYGADAEKKFLEIWRSHIGFFVDYTVAAKKGDKGGMDKAVENLNGYVDAVATLISGANPNLPKEAVKTLVSEHVTLLKGAVDAYGAGDFAKSYSQQSLANAQIGKIADGLSGAIVKQFPDKF